MTDPRFVHLRVHTDYSLADGVVRVKELVKACVEQRMPAVAVTVPDRSTIRWDCVSKLAVKFW